VLRKWWRARREREDAIVIAAAQWISRHGRFARKLAGMRSMDAYLLGDLPEQERWGKIREVIEDSEEHEKPR
jgi:hypothetical protein